MAIPRFGKIRRNPESVYPAPRGARRPGAQLMMISDAADERRLFDRAAVTLATDIRYGGLDCSGFTADVSAMGAFVRATDDADPLLSLLQPGDQVELRLATALTERVSVQARVVRKQSTGVGVQFHQAEPRFDASHILATLTVS